MKKMFYSQKERKDARKTHRDAKKAMRTAKKAFPGVLSLRRWLMSRDKKKEAQAAYREAKANLKVAKKAHRATTLFRKLVFITVMVVIGGAFAMMSYAQSLQEQEVIAYIEANKPEDVAVLPEDAILDSPEFTPNWNFSDDPWVPEDAARIVFFGQTDDGFDSVSASTPGAEIVKVQYGTVATVTADTIDIELPDGALYTVDNMFGLQLGDAACLCFLLAE